jgi:hypothetical protein
MVPIGLILAFLAQLIPGAAAQIRSNGGPFLIALAVLVLGLVRWVGRQFDHYRGTPTAADAFRSPRERRKSIAGFLAIPMFLIAVFGTVSYFLHKA